MRLENGSDPSSTKLSVSQDKSTSVKDGRTYSLTHLPRKSIFNISILVGVLFASLGLDLLCRDYESRQLWADRAFWVGTVCVIVNNLWE